MVSMIIILSSLEQSDNIFDIIDSEAFKFEFENHKIMSDYCSP